MVTDEHKSEPNKDVVWNPIFASAHCFYGRIPDISFAVKHLIHIARGGHPLALDRLRKMQGGSLSAEEFDDVEEAFKEERSMGLFVCCGDSFGFTNAITFIVLLLTIVTINMQRKVSQIGVFSINNLRHSNNLPLFFHFRTKVALFVLLWMRKRTSFHLI